MNSRHRKLMIIRIVVLLLVGLAFLIARLAHAQEPTAAELAKKETVASAFTRGFGYQEYQVRSTAEAMPKDKYGFRPVAQVSSHPADSPHSLIVPGQNVGELNLGDTRDKALTLFSFKPKVDQEFSQQPGCGTELNWVDIKDYPKFRGNVFIRFRENVVFQIDSATTRYRTPEGITVGSSPEDVRSHYPQLRSYVLSNVFSEAVGGRPLVHWIDREKGIAFVFAYSRRTGKRHLYEIIVFRPNSEICPTDDSMDSLAKRELPPYSLEPDAK